MRLLWLPDSPDLNMIEPCWFWMKRQTTKRVLRLVYSDCVAGGFCAYPIYSMIGVQVADLDFVPFWPIGAAVKPISSTTITKSPVSNVGTAGFLAADALNVLEIP